MKILNKLLFISIAMTLFACNNHDENAIYTPKLTITEEYNAKNDYSSASIDDYSLLLNPQQLKEMLDNKEDFAFYFHNKYCENCEMIKPLLIHYILETKNSFYSLDIGNDEIYANLQILSNDLKDSNNNYLFLNGDGEYSVATPEFYFFKNGAIIKKQLVTTNMFNYNYFKKIMNKYLITSTSYIIANPDDINKYRFIYFCNFSLTNNNSLYKNNFTKLL